jgi:hypothetical protein
MLTPLINWNEVYISGSVCTGVDFWKKLYSVSIIRRWAKLWTRYWFLQVYSKWYVKVSTKNATMQIRIVPLLQSKILVVDVCLPSLIFESFYENLFTSPFYLKVYYVTFLFYAVPKAIKLFPRGSIRWKGRETNYSPYSF